jgi:hypothetical protein
MIRRRAGDALRTIFIKFPQARQRGIQRIR